ncbi:MAG: hypothetical protein AB7N91_05555 [Candidatus Tectimicrobiota bacterium]
MPALLTQLATLFEAQGWRYTLHPEPPYLSTGFQTPQGGVSLAFTAPTDDTLVCDALGLTTLSQEHTELLAELEQYLPEQLTLRYAPDNGEVQLRLLLPVPAAGLTAEDLDEPLSLLLALAPLLRRAMPLLQQGLPPQEALQQAQAAAAAEPEAEAEPAALPEALAALLQELAALQDNHDLGSLERRCLLCQAILAQRHTQAAPELWAAIQGELGNSCQRLYDMTGTPTQAQAAVEAYQAALSVYTRDALPTEWAMTQNNLAIVYQGRYERSGEERWATLAVEASQAALTILTPVVAPALAQHDGT